MPTSFTSLSSVFFGALLLAAVPACKKEAPPAPPPATPVATPDTTASCDSDGRVQKFAVNMRVPGNSHNLTFVITSADPTPPVSGKNSWTVQILSAAGTPTSNYTLSATPYMPDHAHGPNTAPVVTPKGNDYVVSNIDFFMGGVWRTTLTAKDAQGNVVDAANVFLCIPG